MAEVQCYFNGRFVPIQSASLPISDLGFVHGITITEQLRTFQKRPFLLDDHLARFFRGLDTFDIQLPWSPDQVASIVEETVSRLIQATGQSECAVGIFATPGSTSRFGQESLDPQFCVYAYALPIEYSTSEFYQQGVRLTVVDIQDTESSHWPKNIKVRSRAHYYLADMEARKSKSLPLLVGANNELRDSSNASPIYVFNPNELTLPDEESVLDSISLRYVGRLADELGMNVSRRTVQQSELNQVRAMGLVNSLYCLVRVNSVNGRRLESDAQELRAIGHLWGKHVGTKFE